MNTFDMFESGKKWLGWAALAYAFSILMRMIWVQWASTHPEFFWHGQLMINTNDGYYFASGARKYLEGVLQHNPRVPDLFDYGVVFFTTWAAKILPVSLDTVILYMPAIVSSLVVVPMILIGRLFGMTRVGFFAALLGSIAWSYYNRTMVGYYDTDMFSAMAPMFILYFLMATIVKESTRCLIAAALAIIVYPFLYDQGQAIVYAMGLIYMGYMFLFHRRERFTWQSIAVIAVALLPLPMWVNLLLVALLLGLYRKDLVNEKQEKIIAAAAIVLFLILGNVFGLIWAKVAGYLIRGTESEGWHFFQVNATVREAGRIPFELMAKRIVGSVPAIFLALVGYLLLVWRHRPFVLALPLIGIGIFSLWGGLRFTVYAVPVAAFGAIYLFDLLLQKVPQTSWRLPLLALVSAAVIYPNITHIIGYKVPTVFNKEEVALLDRLAKHGTDKDYVLTWWDYGYPIWYYGDKNTLIDGGKHDHDNFIVSEILTTPSQLEAARLSRLSVETYVSSGYKVVADQLFKNIDDPAAYLKKLADSNNRMALPPKTRDIYLYLPLRMLDIFPTVAIFSNLDLKTGKQFTRSFFYQARRFKNTPKALLLGQGIELDKTKGVLKIGNRQIPLKRFTVAYLDQLGQTHTKVQNLSPNSPLSLIFMKSYNRFLLVDEKMYQSTFIKMFVLGQYDPDLFEPVIVSPYAKIYKLKI